jgi:dihydropteroate synthase
MPKNNSNPRIFTLNCGGQLLTTEKPLVMGILNVTPDSFFTGSRVAATDHLLERARQMLNAGAAILDIGGQSTRPGSTRLSAGEELERVLEPIRLITAHFPQAIISIDTYYAVVAEAATNAGAVIINDISGGQFDPLMLETVGRLQLPYICMHLPGSLENMHHIQDFKNITLEVLDYFIRKREACENAGIKDVLIDPGFGFGKNREDNFQLLRELGQLQVTGLPIVAGISRKSMIQKTLNVTAADALNGTTVLNTIALMAGASFLRVHDVAEAMEAVTLVYEMKKPASPETTKRI